MIRVFKGRQAIFYSVLLIKVRVNKTELCRNAADKAVNVWFRKGFRGLNIPSCWAK